MSARITLADTALLADPSGALFQPDSATLIVADLHLEKGSHFARRGQFLPPYDTRETLSRLAAVIDRWAPERVVALGDSLHDSAAADRLHDGDREALAILQEGRAWVWVTGNHDPEISARLGGSVVDQVHLGGLVLRHEPFAGPATHEIAGHLHPAARLSIYGHTLRRPCFVGNGRRLVLPAFGAFTGGLNVLDEAFSPLLSREHTQVLMLGRQGIYAVPTTRLVAD